MLNTLLSIRELTFLGLKVISPELFLELVLRFVLNLAVVLFIVRYLYYPVTRRKDYLFSFILISLSVFLLCILLESVKLQIGFAFGLFAIFGIKLPEIAESVISDMASAATPLALIVLGASFEFASIKRYKKNLIAVIFARLIIVPAISLSVAIMIGFRGIDLVSLIGIFASPCAVSSYTMARQMDSDYELSAGTVVFTTMLSCFTLFGWIYFLKELNFF